MRYRSTFLEVDGTTARELVEAPDEQALHEEFHRRGRTLLRVQPVGAVAANSKEARIPGNKLLGFLQSLQGALDAGVPLLTALQAVHEQEDDPRVAAVYEGIADRIATGQQLSDAMAGSPRSFPLVLVAMVRAGEQSGTLPEVLASTASFLEWRRDLASTIRQALIYPAVVLSAGYGLVLFMLSFVIPRLGSVLDKMGSELPAASRALLSLSTFVSGNVPWILAGTVGLVIAFCCLARSDVGRDLFAGLLARLPLARGVVRVLNLAQFCRNLGVMLQAGLSVTAALELSAGAMSVRRYRRDVLAMRDRLIGGVKLTEALAEIRLLPPLAMSMVRVGEEAGRLPLMFDKLGNVYDREVKDSVKKALTLLEPIVTVALGLIVGGVASLVITTIYTAMRGVGK